MNAAARSLSDKLHALWENLDDEERRVFAHAVADHSESPEVAGFAKLPSIGLLLPPIKAMTYGDIEFDVVSPRDPASGQATGVRTAREDASGMASGG